MRSRLSLRHLQMMTLWTFLRGSFIKSFFSVSIEFIHAGTGSVTPELQAGVVLSGEDCRTETTVRPGLRQPPAFLRCQRVFFRIEGIFRRIRQKNGQERLSAHGSPIPAKGFIDRARTNIGDVNLSTPALILDRKTGMLSNYYYHRRRGVLKRRVATPEQIFGNPSG